MQFSYIIPPNLARALAKGTVSSWTLPPPWSEKSLSQWFYVIIINIFTKRLLASWGGCSQIWLFLVLISYCEWWFPQVTARSCISFGHTSHFVTQIYTNYYVVIPIGYVLMYWIGGSILSTTHAWFWVPCIESSITMKGCHYSMWIFFWVMIWDNHNNAPKHEEESLGVREGIFLLLNCSIHGVLPLCMNGQY